jgi:type I restriction enzyme, S subunit
LTELSELPASWTTARLDEAADINPRGFSLAPQALALPVHFVRMAAASEDFRGSLRDVVKGYTAFTTDDVLFAKITPCMENGKGGLVPDLPLHIAFGSTEFHVLRSRGGVLAAWLAKYLSREEFRRQARQNMTGSAGQLRVPTHWLEGATVPVPSLAEQARIVDKLDELFTQLDAGVAELQAAQKKLTLYRQSLLKAAVEGALTAEWRKHNPPQETGEALLARILAERRARWEARQLAKFVEQGKVPAKGWKEKYVEPGQPDKTGLPRLPTSWVWASLDMLGEIASGVAKGGKQADGSSMREVPYLRVANVQRGYLDMSEVKTIMVNERDIADLTLQAGDVLFNEGGDRDKLGRGWVWREEVPECIHQNHVFRMRPLLPEQVPEFISHHGNTFGQKWFQSAGKQTTNLASINLGMLRSFPVPVPPAMEQAQVAQDVAAQLDSLDAQSVAVERGLRLAAAQRQNILRAAFSGQLVPQDPNDEPASVLLDRIRAERAVQAGAKPRKARAAREAS